MRKGYLPDSDEFMTAEDAVLLLKRRTGLARGTIEVDLFLAFDDGTIALQDDESMRAGRPSKHIDSTRKRVDAAIGEFGLCPIANRLYIALDDFEVLANSYRIYFRDIEEVFAGYGPEGIGPETYDVENEIGFTVLGAAWALAKKYPVSHRAMAERIFEAAKQGKFQVRDPHTGLVYVPKSHRYQHERISVSDLDRWLEDSGVAYRLGDDSVEVATATDAKDHGDIDRGQVIRIFSVRPTAAMNRKFWDDKLSRPPKWLLDARTSVGRPGVSSRWNPLSVAHALLSENRMTLRQLDAAFHEHLPELLEQWKEDTELLR